MSEAGQAKSTNGIPLTEFVLTELNIGLQFAELARDSYLRNLGVDGDRQKAAAVHALQTARHFHPQIDAADSQRTLIEKRIAELTTALSKLPS